MTKIVYAESAYQSSLEVEEVFFYLGPNGPGGPRKMGMRITLKDGRSADFYLAFDGSLDKM
jgi:hypothetical protein